MGTYTIWQLVAVCASYFFMTLVIPAILFSGKLQHFRLTVRFMVYQVFGNFFMINLVYVLALLHIANRVTLRIFSILLVVVLYFAIHRKNIRQSTENIVETTHRVLVGVIGYRTFLHTGWMKVVQAVKKLGKWIFRYGICHIAEWAALGASLAYMTWIFATQYILYYGYNVSDLVVHHAWINGLINGKLFPTGIYPFGYHNTIYYMHEVFGMEVYTLIRLFGYVMILAISMMLYAFLRSMLKNVFMPFVGLFGFFGFALWNEECLVRFISALPQEFSMIFLLPSVYFAMLFFRERSAETENDTGKKKKLSRKEKKTAGQEKARIKKDEKLAKKAAADKKRREKGSLRERFLDRLAIRSYNRTEILKQKELMTLWYQDRRDQNGKKIPERKISRKVFAFGLVSGIKMRFFAVKPTVFMEWFKEHSFTRSNSTFCLWIFAMSIATAFTSHFYAVFIAVFGCVGIFFGYIGRFFKKQYFRSILLAVVFAMFLALYPMVIAYAGGTKINGALDWALGVMGLEAVEEETTEELDEEITDAGESSVAGETAGAGETADGEDGEIYYDFDGNVITKEEYYELLESIGIDVDTLFSGLEEDSEEGLQAVEAVEQPQMSSWEILKNRLYAVWAGLKTLPARFMEALVISFQYYVVVEMELYGIPLVWVAVLIFPAGILLGFFTKLRDRFYGSAVISVTIMYGLCLSLFTWSSIGLFNLMDANRVRIFYVYLVGMMAAVLLDAGVYLLLGFRKIRILMQLAGAAVVGGVAFFVVDAGLYRQEPVLLTPLQTNGAVATTMSILKDATDYNWTVVSCNDETEILREHAYHYETIEFLRNLEYYDRAESEVIIPTEYVYFYIEKIPIDYSIAYEDSGQSVSEEGASYSMPEGDGINIYQGQNRWIVMSKMYAYIQAFVEVCPNEVSVYYEDDEFICYVIRQDTYSLYNFAFDYGYNLMAEDM